MFISLKLQSKKGQERKIINSYSSVNGELLTSHFPQDERPTKYVPLKKGKLTKKKVGPVLRDKPLVLEMPHP